MIFYGIAMKILADELTIKTPFALHREKWKNEENRSYPYGTTQNNLPYCVIFGLDASPPEQEQECNADECEWRCQFPNNP